MFLMETSAVKNTDGINHDIHMAETNEENNMSVLISQTSGKTEHVTKKTNNYNSLSKIQTVEADCDFSGEDLAVKSKSNHHLPKI